MSCISLFEMWSLFVAGFTGTQIRRRGKNMVFEAKKRMFKREGHRYTYGWIFDVDIWQKPNTIL